MILPSLLECFPGGSSPPPAIPVMTRWDFATAQFANLDSCNKLLLSTDSQDTQGNAVAFKSYNSGKYVFEVELGLQPSSDIRTLIGLNTVAGIIDGTVLIGTKPGTIAYSGVASPVILNGGSSASASAAATTGDVISVKVDLDAGTVQFFKNGTSLHAATAIDGWSAGTYYYPSIGYPVASGEPMYSTANFGQVALAYPAVATAGYTAGWPAGGTVWNNTLTFGGNYAYTNNDLTLTGSAGTSMSLANIPLSSGKWCYEITYVSGFTVMGAGLCAYGTPLVVSNFALFDSPQIHSIGVIPNTVHNGGFGTSTPFGASFANGDILSCLVDLDVGTVQFYRNGVAPNAPYPIPGWVAGSFFYYPSGGVRSDAGSGALLANFGNSSLAYPGVAIAAGANQGWYVTKTPVTNTTPPTITGTPGVGNVLTASGYVFTGNPAFHNFTWLRDGGENPNNTGAATYTQQPDDQGTTITVTMTATNDYSCASVAGANSVFVPLLCCQWTFSASFDCDSGLWTVNLDDTQPDFTCTADGAWTGSGCNYSRVMYTTPPSPEDCSIQPDPGFPLGGFQPSSCCSPVCDMVTSSFNFNNQSENPDRYPYAATTQHLQIMQSFDIGNSGDPVDISLQVIMNWGFYLPQAVWDCMNGSPASARTISGVITLYDEFGGVITTFTNTLVMSGPGIQQFSIDGSGPTTCRYATVQVLSPSTGTWRLCLPTDMINNMCMKVDYSNDPA